MITLTNLHRYSPLFYIFSNLTIPQKFSKNQKCFEETNNQLGIFQAQSHQLSERLAIPLIIGITDNIREYAKVYIAISDDHIQLAKKGTCQLDSVLLSKNYQNVAISYSFLKGKDEKEKENKYKKLSIEYGNKKVEHFEASFNLQKGAVCYSNYRLTQREDKLTEAKKLYKKAINTFEKEGLIEELFIAKADYASIYFYLGEYDKAISKADSLQLIFDEVENLFKKGMLYQNIGSYHLQLGDIEKGKYYTELAAQYADLNPQIHINLAFVYLSLKEFDKAEYYLFEKLKDKGLDNTSSNYAFLLYGRGLYWQHKKDYPKSINYLKQSIPLFKKSNRKWLIKVKYELGVSYTKKGQLDTGKSYFLKAINDLEKREDASLNDLVLFQNALGELYTTYINPNIDSALIAYQKAINFSLKTPSLKDKIDINATPTIENIKLDNFALAPIVSKGKLLIQEYETTLDIKQLELAISTLELGVQIIDALRYKYSGSYNGIQKMNDDFFLVFDYLTKGYTLMAKASKKKSQLWDQKIFELTEKSRTYLLWHSIAKQNKTNNATLTDNDIKSIYVLNSFIGRKHANLKALSKKREGLKKQEYDELMVDNPWILDYLPKDVKAVTIAMGQNRIDNNQAIIKYHKVKETLYTFVITKNKFELFEEPIASVMSTAHRLEQLVRRQRDLDTKLISSKISREEEREFATKSYQLYQMVLEKQLKILPSQINRLIIIPVDSLQHISFDFLLSKPYENDGIRFKVLNYLINDYAISMVSSVKILEELHQIEIEATNKVSIFAPSYAKVSLDKKPNKERAKNCKELFEEGIKPLKFEEPQAIREVYSVADDAYWQGNSATKKEFKQYCNSESLAVLYCSMHGCVDDNPKSSRLLFTNASNYEDKSNVLLLSEIHELEINAKLVVLSACETGIGLDNSKSEGFSSIAKAFQAAGCPSVVMSRWSVADNSITLSIMKTFSEKLKNGLSIDVALQEAKKEFLEDSTLDEACRPYYWSVLVALGRSTPIFI